MPRQAGSSRPAQPLPIQEDAAVSLSARLFHCRLIVLIYNLMPSYAAQLAFPPFRGMTRKLILANLIVFFLVLAATAFHIEKGQWFFSFWPLDPQATLHGAWWQPITYSFIHPSFSGTFFELLSLWFLAGFLESERGGEWVATLYAASVLGSAATALLLYASGLHIYTLLTGCFGGIFGLLVAIGLLYGDTQFSLLLLVNIRARTLAILYGLLALATLFTGQRAYAFAQIGGALAGYLFIHFGPRRGFLFALSEIWYGMRNAWYRRKRRQAAKKFEVYMKKQGRTVHLTGAGEPIDENDKHRWN